jgi:RimJ/RimL family protein N-acetyltransferase
LQEGRHRQEYINHFGEYKDRLYYGLLKTEFRL